MGIHIENIYQVCRMCTRSLLGSTKIRFYFLGLMAASVLPDLMVEQYGGDYGVDYIYEGTDAKKNGYPWQVRLNKGDWFFCGGSIIDEKNILTAAHCTDKYKHEAQDITVWVRDNDKSRPDGESDHAVCGLTQYPGFKWSPKDKDIAILHLCEPLTF